MLVLGIELAPQIVHQVQYELETTCTQYMSLIDNNEAAKTVNISKINSLIIQVYIHLPVKIHQIEVIKYHILSNHQ